MDDHKAGPTIRRMAETVEPSPQMARWRMDASTSQPPARRWLGLTPRLATASAFATLSALAVASVAVVFVTKHMPNPSPNAAVATTASAIPVMTPATPPATPAANIAGAPSATPSAGANAPGSAQTSTPSTNPGPTQPSTPSATPGPTTVYLTTADNGHTISVAKGTIIVVTLSPSSSWTKPYSANSSAISCTGGTQNPDGCLTATFTAVQSIPPPFPELEAWKAPPAQAPRGEQPKWWVYINVHS